MVYACNLCGVCMSEGECPASAVGGACPRRCGGTVVVGQRHPSYGKALSASEAHEVELLRRHINTLDEQRRELYLAMRRIYFGAVDGKSPNNAW